MKLVYCKELERYSEHDIKKKLYILNEMRYAETIIELKAKRILTTKEDGLYSFDFVGILILSEIVLFCLPKYITYSDDKANITNGGCQIKNYSLNTSIKQIVKQLLMLFREYSRREKLEKEEIESIGNIDNFAEYNMLSVIFFLLNDYIENGLYSNEKNIFVFNGDDEINWSKTIDGVQPIITNGEPIYLDYYTHSTLNDEENYFRLLHKYVLNECTEKLNELGLSEFLEFPPVIFESDEEQLGSPQSIISRISNELSIQFIDRKQLVLKAISSFIGKEKMKVDDFSISFYGTRNFNLVWEKTCAYILDNQYAKIKNIIDKPKWQTNFGKVHETKTLIPDIISISRKTAKSYFVISDAKYYSIQLTNQLISGNPGVEDVTKQYLYQLAYENYIKSQKIDIVKNMLLFPTEEHEMVKMGIVSIGFLKLMDLEDIILIKLPANSVFDKYIKNQKLDIEKFANFEFVVTT